MGGKHRCGDGCAAAEGARLARRLPSRRAAWSHWSGDRPAARRRGAGAPLGECDAQRSAPEAADAVHKHSGCALLPRRGTGAVGVRVIFLLLASRVVGQRAVAIAAATPNLSAHSASRFPCTILCTLSCARAHSTDSFARMAARLFSLLSLSLCWRRPRADNASRARS